MTTPKKTTRAKAKRRPMSLGIPRDFIECLSEHVEGFSAETECTQWGLAWMAWQADQKHRRHRTYPEANSFTVQELTEIFGRIDIGQLIKRVPLFTRTPSWNWRGKITRAYHPTIHARKALRHYARLDFTAPVDLLHLTGKRVVAARTLSAAISSIGTHDIAIPTERWDFAKQALQRIPVNTEMLRKARQTLDTLIADPAVEGELKPWLVRYADATTRLLRLSNTTVADPGHIAQVYAIAPSGRLYAQDVNLQNTPKIIKNVALHGLWEYDFANCHFTIVAQMAAKHGMPCPALEHYMANKSAVRNEIATDAGIPVDLVKRCLLALMYGARTTTWHKAAIPAAIGIDAANRLYAHPRFKAINNEVHRARTTILKKWPRTASGALTNASGKAIAGKEEPAKQLAHLVQGVEAEALRTIVQRHPNEIVLLQHDGFVSKTPLDRESLETAVADAVGYRLALEEERLAAHDDFLGIDHRMKTEIELEAAPVLDFELLDVY